MNMPVDDIHIRINHRDKRFAHICIRNARCLEQSTVRSMFKTTLDLIRSHEAPPFKIDKKNRPWLWAVSRYVFLIYCFYSLYHFFLSAQPPKWKKVLNYENHNKGENKQRVSVMHVYTSMSASNYILIIIRLPKQKSIGILFF